MQSRSLGACLWVRSRRQTTRVLLAWLFGHILLRLRCVCLDRAATGEALRVPKS